MDLDRYFFEGSPFFRVPKPEVYKKMGEGIVRDQYWPQDSIAGELLSDFTLEAPELMVKVMEHKRIRMRPPNFADIILGYTTPLLAINLVIRVQESGLEETKNYIQYSVKGSDSQYLGKHLPALVSAFRNDYTCADIFDYCGMNPVKTNEYCGLGNEISKVEFGTYGSMLMAEMQNQLGGIQTMRIWTGI